MIILSLRFFLNKINFSCHNLFTVSFVNKTKPFYLPFFPFFPYRLACYSISKSCLIHAFEMFGFGPQFRKWTKILTTGCLSSINHGGWLSENVLVSCGIKQGCLFSPLAFILAVETLAIKIRNNEIKGIKLRKPAPNNSKLKIKQFADDTTGGFFARQARHTFGTQDYQLFFTILGLKAQH